MQFHSPMVCLAVVVGQFQPLQIALLYCWRYQKPFADFLCCCISLIHTSLFYHPEANADSELAASVWAISFLPFEIYVKQKTLIWYTVIGIYVNRCIWPTTGQGLIFLYCLTLTLFFFFNVRPFGCGGVGTITLLVVSEFTVAGLFLFLRIGGVRGSSNKATARALSLQQRGLYSRGMEKNSNAANATAIVRRRTVLRNTNQVSNFGLLTNNFRVIAICNHGS